MKQYELHMHTKYSQCSNLELSTILKIAKKRKLDGVAITDHDVFTGAQKLFALNKDKNFEVIRGEELSTTYGHLLVYHLQKEIKSRDFLGIVDEVQEQDALLLVAHPFDFLREHTSKQFILGHKNDLDGIEIFNARSLVPWSNGQAKALAQQHALPFIGGSDAHFWMEIGRVRTCFEGDLRSALKKRKIKILGNSLFGPWGHFLTLTKKFQEGNFRSITKFLGHSR